MSWKKSLKWKKNPRGYVGAKQQLDELSALRALCEDSWPTWPTWPLALARMLAYKQAMHPSIRGTPKKRRRVE